ncbi:MAG: hypothetical protein WDA41_09630 [Candidatus Neomarinimicrobiota bacterium]|jgi:hypothetical protein
MNVGQLIKKLQEFNPEMMVVVDGYEGGFDELVEHNVQIIGIKLNVRQNDHYMGNHDLPDEYRNETPDVEVLLLERGN